MPGLDHPYADLTGGKWLRGNLHAHTTRSDGTHSPQQLIDAYAALGYGFLAISDHDQIATFGDYGRWDDRGLVLIPGNEITADGPHLLHINGSRTVAPDWRRQGVIDDANADNPGGDGGSFVVVNHPNWWQNCDHCPTSLLLSWTGYRGIEIFNGATNMTLGNGYATDKWDQVLPVSLAAGRKVWGFAHDDTHHPEDVGRGWLMAYVRSPGVSGVVEALRQGRFYASTGVSIDKIEVDGLHVRVEAPGAQRIVAVTAYGRRLKIADAAVMEIDVPANEPYVRFDCWGAGEKFAWTQPLVVSSPAGA
jgi:hypothetical protein